MRIEELKNTIIQGDCLDVLKTIPENSVDSIVTDPPYHLVSIVKRFGKEGSAPAKEGIDGSFKRLSGGFMGKTWDGVDENGNGIAYNVDMWRECIRVLKPGGYLLSFGGTRTYHRMACAIEDAGFEVRDMLCWAYGQGFPKSLNVQKQLQKMGSERADEFAGIGTALKPSIEPICMARKPLAEKTVAENCLKYGTGGINIEQSRVLTPDDEARKQKIPSGEVVCNAFCDKHGFYPSSFHDIVSFSPLQLLDFLEHTFSEQDLGNIAYISSLRNLGEIDYKNCKQLLGVPCDYGRLEQRVDEYVRQSLQSLDFLSDYPTLYRLCGVYSQSKRAYDLDVFPLDSDVRADIHRFLSLEESILLCDNNLPLVFVLVCLAYSLLVNNNLHNHYTTCKNKKQVGRFPSNLLHDNSEEVRECFPETKGDSPNRKERKGGHRDIFVGTENNNVRNQIISDVKFTDSGNASRYFKSIPHSGEDFKSLIYQAKASKSERNKGLDKLVLVDIMEVCKEKNTTSSAKLAQLLVGMEQSLPKVTVVSGTQNKGVIEWSTGWFGKDLMEKYQEVCKSTILTETHSITTLPTFNWLLHLLTNEYTADVSLETATGGNLVGSAENYSELTITISEKMASALGVKNVQSPTQLKISVKEGKSVHPTVKPIALMEYLIKMVTPKGGIVLDPFAGSGSTCVAAKELGFNFIGIEKEPDYIQIAQARINAVQNRLT